MGANNEAAVAELVDAQILVDKAEHALQAATLTSIAMTPSNIPSEQINRWRESQVAKEQAALVAARDKRDRCLRGVTPGMTLEQWLEKWAAAKAGVRADKSA